MSSIDQLKAEAIALREAEKARGNALKHCDALELVAKKHGYANWRSCLATLGGVTPPETSPTPTAAPTSAAPQIVPSRLLDGDLAAARQSAFTHWMKPELRQAAVDFSRTIGLVPIFAETSRDGTRYLFWHLPNGAKCEVRSGRSKEQFLEFDRASREQGRRLVSLHTSVDSLYSAVWISVEHHALAAEFLKRFGITVAEMP
jgi:hypothetical protein